jgi:hypothetical protein
MPKLSEQQILRVHRLAESGLSNANIANQIGCHRNTITSHLHMRAVYSLELIRKIGIKVGLPSTERISPYDAAIYLPGWPSQHKIDKLRRHGVLETCSTSNCERAWTTERKIRKAARKMLPEGVWFASTSLELYFDACDARSILRKLDGAKQHCRYWPCRHYHYLNARQVFAMGFEYSIRPGVISRVSECLRISGVATL